MAQTPLIFLPIWILFAPLRRLKPLVEPPLLKSGLSCPRPIVRASRCAIWLALATSAGPSTASRLSTSSRVVQSGSVRAPHRNSASGWLPGESLPSLLRGFKKPPRRLWSGGEALPS